MDRLLRDYYATARGIVERYGGIVEKFIGDAVVGLFGVPLAHEDDAERAVRAALSLREEVHRFAPVAGVDVQIRIGVNTGPAVVRTDADPSSGEGLLSGDTINTAARLQQAASPMQIVVGEKTHALTRHAIEYEATPPRRVKGKQTMLNAWLAHGPIASAGIDLGRTFSTPFVGRRRESRILRALFDAAAATSTPRFVLLTGEAGQGKSRLLFEFARALDERPGLLCTWRQGRCPAYAQEGAFPVMAEIVRQQAGILRSDDEDAAAQKLERLGREGQAEQWVLERLRPLVGLRVPAVPIEETFAAWRHFIQGLAQSHPAVIVFEDLHWASEATLEFIEYLVHSLEAVPLLMILTGRPELLDTHPALARCFPWSAPSTASSIRLDVGSLSEGETGELVRALATETWTTDAVETASRLCGGNPLYAEELVRWMTERPDAAGSAAATTHAMPLTLEGLLAARLDALRPAHRGLLVDAAVVGETFWPGALAAMGRRDLRTVEEGLAELCRRQFVRRRHSSRVEGDEEFLFWHALTHDVAYARLTRGSRAKKHAAVAAWGETCSLRETDRGVEFLAHHYSIAASLARKADEPSLLDEVRGPAADTLALAAERASSLDMSLSEKRSRQALEIVEPGHPNVPSLLVSWGAALGRIGRLSASLDALETGIIGLLSTGRTREAGRALIELSAIRQELGDHRCIEAGAQALRLLQSGPPSADAVAALNHWAGLCLWREEPAEAMAAADEAAGVARLLNMPVPLITSEWRAVLRVATGDAREALADLRHVRDEITEGRDEQRVPSFFVTMGCIVTACDNAKRGLDLFGEGLEHARRHNDERAEVLLRTGALEARALLGEWSRAQSELALLEEELVAKSYRSSVWDVHDLRILLLALSGASEVDDARGASRATQAWGDPPAPKTLHLLSLALASHAAGDSEQSRALLAAMTSADDFAAIPTLSLWWPNALRLAAALAAPALADELAATVLRSNAPTLAAKTTAEAMRRLMAGETAKAADLFGRSAGSWGRHAVPFEAAHAELARAACLLELGRASEAAGLADRAADTFKRLGARPSLELVRPLRERIAGECRT